MVASPSFHRYGGVLPHSAVHVWPLLCLLGYYSVGVSIVCVVQMAQPQMDRRLIV